MSTQKTSLFSALASMRDEIGQIKTAAAKKAESPTPADPGGMLGATTHPSKNVDNGAQEATEGARSAENEKAVKADQGAPGVNSASDAQSFTQDSVQLNIGMTQSGTGEDPSVEDNYKDTKDDPGSSVPARTDNKSLDNSKYASASLQDLANLYGAYGNSILADIANGYGGEIKKASPAKTPAPAAQPQQPEQPQSELSQQIIKSAQALAAGKVAGGEALAANADLRAGYDLAAVLGVEKRAAQEKVAVMLADVTRDAVFDAELVGGYLSAFQKQAEAAEPNEGENHDASDDDTSGSSEAEGAGGVADGSGGPPKSEMAPPSTMGDLGGIGEMLGGGGGEPAPAGPAMGGSPEQAIEQLVAALDELGIPIEELAAAGGEMGGGEMGGGEMGGLGGEMGGDPPAEGAPPADTVGMKLASMVRQYRRSGKYQLKAANAGTPERQLRDQMKSYVLELVRN